MLRWMLGNLGLAVVFRRAVCGRALVPPEAGMMFTMALWLAVYRFLHRAGELSGRTAQMEHPGSCRWCIRVVCRIECGWFSTLCRSLHIARVIWPWGTASGERLGHEAPPPAPGTAGAEQGFSTREKKRQNSVDVIHAVLFLCGDGDGTAHSGKMILNRKERVEICGEFDIIYQNKYVLDSRNLQVIYEIPVKSQNPRFAQKEIPPYNQSTQAGSKP